MIKIENTEVLGWEHAIRGMHNPMNSWEKSDSEVGKHYTTTEDFPNYVVSYRFNHLGPNDLDLMKRLRNAGTDHRKFMRMIVVYVDITAPLYWWKEFDTYKVGTVANSCSTMHKIAVKEFTLEDFSYEHLMDEDLEHYNPNIMIQKIVNCLNECRQKYLDAKNSDEAKKYWWQMIQLLPSSYNQRRTVMLNYEVLANIYKSRKGHKLDEWREHGRRNVGSTAQALYSRDEQYFGFCDWIKTLPYSEIIVG